MKKLLALALLLLSCQAWGATKLEVVDYLPMKLYSSDSSYVYGTKSGSASSIFYRLDSLTGTSDNTHNFGATYNSIDQVFSTSTTGLVFAMVQNTATSKYYLFKSVDSGSNFGSNSPTFNDNNYVLALGDVDGSVDNQISSVYLLNRGFAEFNGKLYAGEYNVNGSRTNGAANDQVRLMESSDNGTTWSVKAKWNTDGSNNNTRHIHSVQSNGGSLYVTFGDTDPQTGILRWDGSATIDNNAALSTYSTALSGSQNLRTGDILFPSGSYMYYMSDTSSDNATRGIHRLAKDLSDTPTIVDNTVTSYDNHSGWYGLVASNGTLVFSEFLESGSTDNQINLYTSADGGASWSIVAKYGAAGSTGGAVGFFEWDGNFYFSRAGSGKNDISTAVFNTSGTYSEDAPVVLNPVYWVATTGTDSAGKGYRPSTPLKTFQYTLTGDRITYGARVIFAGQTFDDENATLADWNGNARPGTGTVVFEGAGIGSTLIRHKVNDNATYLAYISDTAYPTSWKNMTLDSKSSTTYLYHQRAGTTATYKQVGFGSATYSRASGGAQFYTLGTSTLDRCTIASPADNVTSMFTFGGNSASLTMNRSITSGGKYVTFISGRTGTTLSLNNNTFYGYGTSGITFGASTTFASLAIKNNIFSGVVASADIVDAASLTETDAQIDYNLYLRGVAASIANTGGTHRVNADPLFVNAAGGDFRLQPGSPAINAGVDVGLTTDYLGNGIRGLPDIGAYEFVGSLRLPNFITFPSFPSMP